MAKRKVAKQGKPLKCNAVSPDCRQVCQLPAGHAGPHRERIPARVYRWHDERRWV